MIIDARTDVQAGARLTGYDVCIVGAGAAGITLALELAGGPLKVCVLESGGVDYEDETQELYAARTSGDRYPSPLYSRLRFFGGATNHWDGSCRPLDVIDFEERPGIADSGWPFPRSALDEGYAAAYRYCELGGETFDTRAVTRQAGLSPAPVDPGVLETIIHQSSPPTRFAEAYGDRLRAAQNVTVILHANVTKVGLDRDGKQVVSLPVAVLEGGEFEVTARAYVLALGGIENPRLLLNSTDVQKAGVGNQHDLVGRYYMDHPVLKAAVFYPTVEAPKQYLPFHRDREAGSGSFVLSEALRRRERLLGARIPLFPTTRFEASEGIESFHALRRALTGEELRGGIWEHVGNVASDLDMVVEGVSRTLFGTKLFDSADEKGLYLVDAMLEQPPERTNRVRLDEKRDALGLQRVVVEYRLSEEFKANIWRGFEIAAREFGRSGLGRLRLLRLQGDRLWDELLNFGHHHMGGTRAHRDPKRGVVDGDLRVHDCANLYIAGSSVFPTGGFVPPTLTIVAMAVRLAGEIGRRYGA